MAIKDAGQIQIGDILVHDVTIDSNILAPRGTIITVGRLDAIRQSGLHRFEVSGNAFDDPTRQDKNRHGAALHGSLCGIVDNEIAMETLRRKEELNRREEKDLKLLHRERERIFDEIRQRIAAIVDELLSDRRLFVSIADLRSIEDYTIAHSVSVCLLSLELGKALSYTRAKLQKLAMGAILHDIGKHKVPDSIHYKPDSFTPEEYEEMKKHARYGYDMLKNNPCVELTIAHVAYQHQEKFDGAGYPRGIAGAGIHEYARIVAVADVYDAVLSKRPYKKAMLPHEAMELLLGSGGSHFDLKLVKQFTKAVSVYREGNILELDSGEIARVVKLKRGLSQRPVVQPVFTPDGAPIENGAVIDLSQEITRRITELIRD